MAIQLLTVCILFTGAFGRTALLPQPYPNKPVNYGFTYGVRDAYSGTDFARQEEGTVGSNPNGGNNVKGRYHVLLPDGRLQLVTYEADENGYRAEVTYEGEAHHQPLLPPKPYGSAHVHHHHHNPAPAPPAAYRPVPVPHLPIPFGSKHIHQHLNLAPTPPAAYNPLPVPYSPTDQHHLPPHLLPVPAHHIPVHLLPAHHFPAHHIPAHHRNALPLHPVHPLPFQYAPHHLHGLPIPFEGTSSRLPANTYHLSPHPLATTEAPAEDEVPEFDAKSILNVPVIIEVETTENEIKELLEAVIAEESEETSEEEASEVVAEDEEVPEFGAKSILNVPLINLVQPNVKLDLEKDIKELMEAVIGEESEVASEEEAQEVVTEAVEVSTDFPTDSADSSNLDIDLVL